MGETRKGIALLGSTGSIGTSTLEVVRRYPERFKVVSLAAGNNVGLLKKQILEFKPEFVSVLNEETAKGLRKEFDIPFGSGTEGAVEAATLDKVNVTVSAIAGAAGLLPTLASIKAGKDIALANKETLVLAGPLVMEEVRKRGVNLLPVDSEHSAIFQSLSGHRKEDLKRIILTASGGPFLNTPLEDFISITPEAALKHPKWSMGRKITVDSATLVNKGLEVIEASFLFDLPAEKISVAIHPQSIVHSMVEYIDGSIIAQMSVPDMKGPIAYALSYPGRIDSGAKPLSFEGLSLEFMEPDLKRFPCLGLACEALKIGGTAPAALNAADEVAVEMFLSGKLPFTGIHRVISEVLERHKALKITSIEDVLQADKWGRETAFASVSAI
ncbi:MAG: 1-deoxy-D-xylulose-5-phosphate reductoisomerase [Deltaproteobacteria bacterium]|nr:1-deoxy-D-xylulose-5-phosphate reductoisomerase [Deltaproteobacteria bacterium]